MVDTLFFARSDDAETARKQAQITDTLVRHIFKYSLEH